MDGEAIDRHALVARHNVTLRQADLRSPLSVGNGEFAFTADITGLQTFQDDYEKSMPLCTQSQWAWHSFPNPDGYGIEDAQTTFDVHGRQVPYASQTDAAAGRWLRVNPHRLHLGRIGLALKKSDGMEAKLFDLTAIEQTLDLWTGLLTSRFMLESHPVTVLTVCHPCRDLLAVRIESPLIGDGRLQVEMAFPYGSDSFGPQTADWESPDAHRTQLNRRGDCRAADLLRVLDDDRYCVGIAWSGGAQLAVSAEHHYMLRGPGRELEFVCEFSETTVQEKAPDWSETRAAAAASWKDFWSTGGAIDLSHSADPRWRELERRIVLSQYLAAIQCAGSRPPQETGLTCNSWHGKFHLEMHWWHAAHFPLWGRTELLERSLPWYARVMPNARETARRQGYDGVRWPKMVGPDGRESPSDVGVFLHWQQPHPIYYAELCYRAHSDQTTLDRHRDIVLATAEFMAAYACWNEREGRYQLGPPMIPAQERGDPRANFNGTFELAYWRWGLRTAQAWRERLGLKREARWDHVAGNLSPLPAKAGLYLPCESATDAWDSAMWTSDHPSMLGALGILPGEMVDEDTMRRTLHEVFEVWDWESTWGWDYPMAAMTAARLGEPDLAIRALLMDVGKNTCLPNGHNRQDSRLPLYLPGNGGLLTAAAMMTAGWDGGPARHAPGFPDDDSWNVRWEGLSPMP